jgi:spermidine/putrescine transport system permease protein
MGNPWLGIVPVLGYLLLFYLVPIGYLLLASFRETQGSGLEFAPTWTLNNYRDFFASQASWTAYGRSLAISSAVVFFSVLFAYPLAYVIALLVPRKYRHVTLLLIIAPVWTSFVIRAFAWQLLLADAGPLNTLLQHVGLPSLNILYTHVATVMGLTVFGTMLTTLNLYAVMENISPNLLAAAADLGAQRWATFKEVILPLSFPGMMVGAMLTFIISFGDFIVPSLLGGGIRSVLAQVMVGAVTTNFNIPRAATYSVIMLLTILVVTLPMLRFARQGLNTEA